ncbi:unnamed protein product [Dibothriocephalus latus]|uniref:Uncharacterized protein n=1 Tax=Dibothriocephalus latus TaxID=60516 RepID=A0A3P7LAZ7_DIBLA|nr:unnamed protein product [Dibothriocephalus latus]
MAVSGLNSRHQPLIPRPKWYPILASTEALRAVAAGVSSMNRQQAGQRSVPLATSMPSDMNHFPSPDRTYIDQEGTVRRLSSLQREKLSQDLMVVQTNVHILNDMLTELQPDSVNPDDLELLQGKECGYHYVEED